MVKRANDGKFVREIRQLGEVLTNLYARHFGRDWAKLAAHLRWCVRLHVKRLQLAGTAPHEEEDARLNPRRFGKLSPCSCALANRD